MLQRTFVRSPESLRIMRATVVSRRRDCTARKMHAIFLVSCPGNTLHMFVCLWDRLLTRAALYFQRAPEPRA